jgi:hypothetical protein
MGDRVEVIILVSLERYQKIQGKEKFKENKKNKKLIFFKNSN